MGKALKIIFGISFCVLILYYILGTTGMYRFHKIRTTSSEPNVKLHSVIVTSNLISFKKGDFIAYTTALSESENYTAFSRICAMANDTVQLIKGTLFVNGKNFDENYNLKHAYLLSEEVFNKHFTPEKTDFQLISEKGKTAYLTFVTDVDCKLFKLQRYRYRNLQTIPDSYIQQHYQQPWNKDYFGPIIIPEHNVFVLSDNRDNAWDSRFHGLVHTDSITGVYAGTLYSK